MTAADDQRAQAQAAFGEPEEPRRRPSRAGFFVAAALIAATVGGAVLWLVLGLVGFSDSVDKLDRVPVPGHRILDLGTGRHAIYYEGPGGEHASIPAMRILLRPEGGGAVVPIGSYSGSVSYSMSGHAGRSLAGFGIADAGRYRMVVRASNGAPAGAVLAVGRGLGGKLVRAIVGAIVIFLVGLLVAGGLIAVTAVRRSRGGA